MKYQYNATDAANFEIPDEWLKESGFVGFKPVAGAYVCGDPEIEYPRPGKPHPISLLEIEPISRTIGVGGFLKDRMIPILKGIQSGDRLPPIVVIRIDSPDRFKYRMYHGFHRYHASIAAGFTHIPAFVSPSGSSLIG